MRDRTLMGTAARAQPISRAPRALACAAVVALGGATAPAAGAQYQQYGPYQVLAGRWPGTGIHLRQGECHGLVVRRVPPAAAAAVLFGGVRRVVHEHARAGGEPHQPVAPPWR